SARFWSVDAGEELLAVEGASQSGPCNSAVFVSSGFRMLTAGGDGAARLWRVETEGELASFSSRPFRAADVAFAGDWAMAVTADSDGSLRLWDVMAGREANEESLSSGAPRSLPTALGASPDGRRVAAGRAD